MRPDLEIIICCLLTRPNVKTYSATVHRQAIYIDKIKKIISKSAENIGRSAEYSFGSAEITKNLCIHLNLDSKILQNGPYTQKSLKIEKSLKIVYRLKYFLRTRLTGHNTISRSGQPISSGQIKLKF